MANTDSYRSPVKARWHGEIYEGIMRATGHDRLVGLRQAAQAVELVRALRDQLEEMVLELTWVERQRLNTSRGSRVSALRWKAASLRRDIDEAKFLIDRLQRRHLNAD